jgi:hypothetical protein
MALGPKSAGTVANPDQLTQPSPSSGGSSVSSVALSGYYCQTVCNLERVKRVVTMVVIHRAPLIGFAAIASMALISACGSKSVATHASSHSSPATNPTAGTTSSPSPLFAVLETRRAGAQSNQTHDTVAIANAQGYAVAKSSFTPRSIPPQFGAATVMQPEAYVAAGAVYYADGRGIVRRLDPTGRVATVATFPLTSAEQELSFAVSPDGSQLIAARLTFPRLVGATPPPTPTGNWILDIMMAPSGGATATVQHLQAGSDSYPGSPGGFTTIFVVGWDSKGPIGLIGANFGAQQGSFQGQRFFGGRLAYVGLDGRPGAAIGGSDCEPFASPVAGEVICATNSGAEVIASVRGLDGRARWKGAFPVASSACALGGGFALSPDGSRLATDGQIVTLATSATVPLPTPFTPVAWLGSNDLIGMRFKQTADSPCGDETVGVVHLTPRPSLENWGFSGQVVGAVLP